MSETERQQPASERLHELEDQRRSNRDDVVALGFSPYGRRTDNLSTLIEARRAYDEAADERHKAREKDDTAPDQRPTAKVAGRIVLHRDTGRLVFMNLRDHTGDLQIAVSKRDCDEAGFKLAKIADLGDLVIAEGPITKTRTGEVTIWVGSLSPASKCLTPPPEKHAGLQDVEQRYRKRYIDLWSSPDSMRSFQMRSHIVSRIRRFLDERSYLEVETPMLQSLAGGAAARPFMTHMNALDLDLYLRVAPELYLKRLLVGGMPRVYEINRNFRNEGVDKTHNPEFTVLELYQAHGNYRTMLELTESLIRELATMVITEERDADADRPHSPGQVIAPADEDELPDSLVLSFGEHAIDYGARFVQITYAELFRDALGFEIADAAAGRTEAQKRDIKTTDDEGRPLADILVINGLFERVAEPTIDPARPTFVLDYPAALSPLTRAKPGTENDPIPLAERWDLFIAGMEIGPAYTELNDPDVQAERFKQQLAGLEEDESTFRTYDEDFIDALKVGMPPAGGLGLGIDRLVMLLTNQATIRDVILFPLLRPRPT